MSAPALARPARLLAAALLAPVSAALAVSPTASQDTIPREFRGDWVASSASCDSPVRFRVTDTEFSLINRGDTASWGDVAVTYTFFGPDYRGIQVVAMPDFNSGNAPFMATFNADEKRGITRLDIYQPVENPTRIPALEAIQAAAKALAARFPIDQVDLKRCPRPARAPA